MTWLIATVIAGFPVTLVLAWLFEIGPDGIVRTKPGSATGVGAIVISRRIGDSDPNSAEHSLEYLSARDFQLS